MTNRCPHCAQIIPAPKPKGRVCFDCKGSIRLHDKWTWAERDTILTCVHRHCDNPGSYHPAGQDPIAPAPLFEGAAQ